MRKPLFCLVPTAGLLLAACSTLAPLPPPAYPQAIATTPAIERLITQTYASLEQHKALAISADGHYGYGWGGVTIDRSARTAMNICQHYAQQPCRLHLLDERPAQEDYLAFSRLSHAALQALQLPDRRDYHFEGLFYDVAPPSEVRLADKGYEDKTPATLPGITTLKTYDLVKVIRQRQPLLLDAKGWNAPDATTLPGACTIDWLGTLWNRQQEAAIVAELRRVMISLEPDKSRPIVVFCASAECWLSINALLRLQAIGYQRLYWYRGGLEAWKAARLPLVPAVMHATVFPGG
ncbi:rhodanese-like domain-containing protein [Vogesella sp. LIG4]|uniref:rhodanese-like domain-containing protein n=1 Tax=Vogesella sp. LIG4 TaxID=1192162 RepID=UPI0008200659|nr:rhodanese-like domain-containing protein [Vogesella sp. LIG4]SCK30895.1 PQQ-dependent catabolism-associated CXXCW motif protein [Vogesella sp. LIG4]